MKHIKYKTAEEKRIAKNETRMRYYWRNRKTELKHAAIRYAVKKLEREIRPQSVRSSLQ